VNNPTDVVYETMNLDMRVLEVDPIHRRIVLAVTNIPEEQPPRPEKPSEVLPMDEGHEDGTRASTFRRSRPDDGGWWPMIGC
jgi:hypothetical protein